MHVLRLASRKCFLLILGGLDGVFLVFFAGTPISCTTPELCNPVLQHNSYLSSLVRLNSMAQVLSMATEVWLKNCFGQTDFKNMI